MLDQLPSVPPPTWLQIGQTAAWFGGTVSVALLAVTYFLKTLRTPPPPAPSNGNGNSHVVVSDLGKITQAIVQLERLADTTSRILDAQRAELLHVSETVDVIEAQTSPAAFAQVLERMENAAGGVAPVGRRRTGDPDRRKKK